MQSRGRGRGPGEGAPGDFRVGSRGWDFAGKAQRWQLRRIPQHCPPRARAAQGRRAAPQSRRAKGGGAPAKWPGSAPGLGRERCARGPGSWRPCASRGAAGAPGGELTLWKEKSNCSFAKDVKLRRPASSRRAFASARRAAPRRAAPQSPPGPVGWERGAVREVAAPEHGVWPGVLPGAERGRSGFRQPTRSPCPTWAPPPSHSGSDAPRPSRPPGTTRAWRSRVARILRSTGVHLWTARTRTLPSRPPRAARSAAASRPALSTAPRAPGDRAAPRLASRLTSTMHPKAASTWCFTWTYPLFFS